MNDLISALIIAVVQGITEWVPVSSSGHLVVVERLLGFQGGLVFDVALHFGTLMAVFVYFGKDIVDILEDLVKGKWKTENGKLGWLLILATIPAGVVGFLFKNVFEVSFENLGIVAVGFGVTGVLLFISSVDFSKVKKREKVGVRESFAMGVAQVFSLIPGISRSGSTISVGLLSGLNEKSAMKFAFLMSVPVIFGANIIALGDKVLEPNLIWATLVSFVVGLLVIHLLYTRILLNRKNLIWFGIYAVLLGVAVGIWSFVI
jgi:undecaprenyl-diphosphatase